MELLNIFTPSPVYSIFSVGIAGIVGLVIGYLLRSGVTQKHKKRVLQVENEMLSNHSRILELEKEITDLKNANSKLSSMQGKQPSIGLKAS